MFGDWRGENGSLPFQSLGGIVSLNADTGNAFLDAYARQIDELENNPNATRAYDKGLEAEFDKIKAQVLGTKANGSGQADGSGKAGSASGGTKSGGTGGTGSKSGGADGSDAGGAASGSGSGSGSNSIPPEADSISKVKESAGGTAAAQVQKIADGAAAQIGGSDGPAVAGAPPAPGRARAQMRPEG
jgi:hypothetical protein